MYAYAALSPPLLVDPAGYEPEYNPDFRKKWKPPRFSRGIIKWTGGDYFVLFDNKTVYRSTLIGSTALSFVSGGGAAARVVTYGGKGLRAFKANSCFIGRGLEKLRKVIRYDRAHHGKPPHWDGWLPKFIGRYL